MKEAEKLFKEWLDSKNLTRIGYRYYDVVNWDGAEPEERFYNEIKLKEAFIAGFNADRWYYPSRKEYPTEKNKQYLCRVKDCREVWYEVADWDDFWLLDKFNQVVAWQYIDPPKERENG